MSDMDWRTCSVCGKMDVTFRNGSYVLFHYSTRRYAHAHCMVAKWGIRESQKLIRHPWLIKLFRAVLAKDPVAK